MFLWVVISLSVAMLLFFTAAHYLEWEGIENWRLRMFREFSSWFQMGGIATTIMNLPIDPTQGLYVWNMAPRVVRELIPYNVLLPVGLTFFVLAFVSKYIKQKRMREKVEAKARAEQEKASG